MSHVIKCLTLVVRRHDFVSVEEGVVPSFGRLRATFQDVAIVDRVVFVDGVGNRTFLKNRYPVSQLSKYRVDDHEIERPRFATITDVEDWCERLSKIRIHLHVHGEYKE